MSQSGYTPIQLYYSTTAAAVPVNTNLANGELAINITDGKLYYKDNGGTVRLLASNATSAPVLSFSAGTTGFTPSSATSGAVTLAGTLATTNGGTGLTAFTANQVFYASSTSAFAQSANLTFNGTTLTANTIGAFTLSGTIAGGGNQINNVIIGTSTPLAGSFTTLTASTSITNSSLTTGRVVYTTTGGLETSSANLLYSGTDLTVYGLTVGRGAGSVSTNTAVGASAFSTNTTGANSVAVGAFSLGLNSTGNDNTVIGYGAGYYVTGSGNTGVGRSALSSGNSGASGGSNTAVGYYALQANTTASNNTAVGYQAAYTGTTAADIVAIGFQALNKTTADNNVAVGSGAGFNTAGGGNNTFMGYQSGYGNTTASFNSAYGLRSFFTNTTGQYNTALGYNALYSNTTASNNTAVGYQAGYNNTTATYTTAIGYKALFSQTTASGNTALGYNAGYTNTGINNTFVGFNSGAYSTSSGNYSTFIGYAAGANTSSGEGNTFIGAGSGYETTTGGGNTGIGKETLTVNTTGIENTCVGYLSGDAITTGGYNCTLGTNAGGNITTGDKNICIGQSAGRYTTNLTTGAWNIIIGALSVTNGSADGSSIVIGPNISGKGSSTGFISPGGGAMYNGANTSTWSTTSDRRLKKNIVDNNTGLEKLTQIQVRNFEYRLPEEVTELDASNAIQKTGVQLGVIAQELQAVLPECVKQESTGVLSVDPDKLTWYLVNAVKQLSAKVEALEAQLNKGA